MKIRKISIGVLFFSIIFSYGQDTINKEKKNRRRCTYWL